MKMNYMNQHGEKYVGKVDQGELSLFSIAEEITDSGSFDWNIQTGETRFSDGMFQVLGLKKVQNPNLGLINSVVHQDDAEGFKALMSELKQMENRSDPVAEFRIIIGESIVRYIWLKLSPVYDDNNQLIRILGAIQDITERKKQEILTEVIYNISQAASDLTQFREFYIVIQKEINKLVDANNMFVAFYDEKADVLDIQYVTGESGTIDHVPADKTISKLVMSENCSLLLDNNTLLDFDKRGKIKRVGKSSKTWLGVPLRKGNDPFGVLVVQNYERDKAFNEEDQALLEYISLQLVSAIRSMQDSEQIDVLNNSVKQSPVSIVITNKDGDIEYVNPKFEEITGYSLAEVYGENPRVLNSGTTEMASYQDLWETIMDGRVWQGEFKNKKKDGSFYWEQASISPVKNKAGEISHFVAVKEDITERKILDKELLLAKEKAEESDKLKTAFLANMSHEIRTPMNGILGFSELLRDNDLSKDETSRYIDIINSNGRQLLGIIDDIITVSNLEVQQLKLNVRQFDMVSFLERIRLTVEMESRYIEKDNISLIFPILEQTHCQLEADEGKIQQILINLLKNALKFTRQGSVTLKLSEPENGLLLFQVEDTGLGISAEMQEVIFNRFRQVDDSNTRSFGGTGLGLAISKGLVELMGGNIWLKSSLGKGSSFSFSVPVKKLQ
ncbi:MAG: PAS domain S-box protein [Bacteroidota bacterium]|nr:PAS domain S-box protein [Bacteroidota bacterium]